MSSCFFSSRLKMRISPISALKKRRSTALPNVPVPPVMTSVLLLSIRGLDWLPGVSERSRDRDDAFHRQPKLLIDLFIRRRRPEACQSKHLTLGADPSIPGHWMRCFDRDARHADRKHRALIVL